MTTTYIAPELVDQGYTGATGATPYKPATVDQTSQLQAAYNTSFSGIVSNSVPAGAISLNINFDGTQNNRLYPDINNGEVQTNIGRLSTLQENAGSPQNTLYFSGVGAQTVDKGTLDANGNPVPGSSPSSWESTPWRAGDIANDILEQAYERLTGRVSEILSQDSNAIISLNLTGFSRGGAEAVAFANLLNERGIPGLYEPGSVPINSMVLFDPVDQTSGSLNIQWPTNVNNSLVMVAMNEGRAIMPAMPVGANAIVVGVPGAHSDVGGSFGIQGISAVTLKMAREFLEASGVPIGSIPSELSPDWDQMVVHNSGLDNFANVKWSFTEGNRYYEGGGLGSIAVQDVIGNGLRLDPVFVKVNGKYEFTAFSKTVAIDSETGERTTSKDITIYDKDAVTVKGRSFESFTSDVTGQITNGLKVTYAGDGATILTTVVTERQVDNSVLTTTRDGQGGVVSTSVTQTFDDKSSITTTTVPSTGATTITSFGVDGKPTGAIETIAKNAFESTINTYSYDAEKNQILARRETRTTDFDGSYYGTEVDFVNREIYTTSGDIDGVQTRVLNESATANLQGSDAAQAALDLLNFGKTLGSQAPWEYKFASGVVLLNKQYNSGVGGSSVNANFSAASTVARGALSVYSLSQAFKYGDAFDKVYATANTVSFVNYAFNATTAGTYAVGSTAASVNSALNGGVNGLSGGTPGILPALGLVSAIKNNDAVGMVQNSIALYNPALLFNPAVGFTPLGWAFMAYTFYKLAIEDNTPPKAWGMANVTFTPSSVTYGPDLVFNFGSGGAGYGLQINANGENFGVNQVRAQMQNTIAALGGILDQNNANNPDSTQHLGLIAQRMPSLSYKAAEFADKGFAVKDFDPITGEQRFHDVRFDDNGQVFNINPANITPELRAMLTVQGAPNYPQLNAYMLNSALQRQAIAPMWEVNTARLQADAGDPNAGLTEEVRAAKAGLAARLDAAYAAAHPNDPNANNKRLGNFMPIGIDLDPLTGNAAGAGTISTETLAQTGADGTPITFDWDGQGYQKKTGWIAGNDGFLVLDRNFNSSVDGGLELLSNPLVADPAKGLRSLAAFDANGDGRIDALDPVFAQLKIWQDLDQDGNNTHAMQLGPYTETAQDETGGVKELRSLADWGITAIDYNNGRYEFSNPAQPGGVGYGAMATVTLEASQEGVRYTGVGAGIKIDATDGAPEIVVTQVLSEAAVYDLYALEASGETIGVPGAELYEDGVPYSYNPNTQGGPITQRLARGLLLQNDTWHGLNGLEAGLVISAVGNGEHVNVWLEEATGDVLYTLETNFSGAAQFDYTVTAPDGSERTARVNLNITSVNDAPELSVLNDVTRPVYGYTPLTYTYTWTEYYSDASFDRSNSNTVAGAPIYAPYVEEVRGAPIYQQQYDWENGNWVSVVVGYQPSTYVNHNTPITQESANTGYVGANDPDGDGSFTYQVIANPLYGSASVDATTGRWSYVGLRPSDYQVPDVSNDGVADYVNSQNGQVYANRARDNVYSNQYIGSEQQFTDSFTVRVFDGSGGYTDKQIQTTHYGPPPGPTIASSGGKKPIGVDLDGNGFHFTNVDDSNVFFDVNGDGWKRKIAWTAPGDGLLAYDHNGDGKIDRFDEIGFVPYAMSAQTDLAALKQAFDTNGNGVLDAGDEQWAKFGIWQDANSNGVTDEGEFKSLTEMGIVQLGLTSDGKFEVIDGQTVHGLATATKTDGSTLALADVTLQTKNITQVTTTESDGSTSTAAVALPAFPQGEVFEGTPDKDLVFGTRGSDYFNMGDGNDVVVDDGGDDVVEGGDGDDLIYTGMGGDIVFAGAGNDVVYAGAGDDLVFGGDGNDMLMLEDGNDVAMGGAGNDFISGGNGNDVLSGNQGDDQLFGEDGWDVLFGQEGDDELYGMDGNDQLYGQEGNDLLDGGAGDDQMEGGAGNDIYVVDSVGDVIVELADEGVDTVRASISYTLADDLENLTLTGSQNLNGTGNAADNLLIGNDGNNTLAGLEGNDVLDGGLGADTMIGGAGDDSYVVDNAGDVVVELAGEGVDTVRSRVSTTLSANVENLTLTGINAINGTGNELDNVVIGNTATNRLDGGLGADLMRGGRGNDTYLVDNAGDVVEENADEGVDSVIASISYALTANVENLTLTGSANLQATGNELNNTITGNAGDNLIDGGDGADAMAGGAGNDAYVVDNADDTVQEAADEGVDTVLATVSYGLSANVENLVLTGTANINATGNELNNTIAGNAGDNLIDGGAGADAMAGGAGNDTYVVDDAGDVVTEWFNEGVDTVVASINYVLPQHVDNLRMTGGAINGVGNSLDNQLIGNAQDNWLDGGAGADVMAGGAGNDTYVADNASDLVVEAPGEGADTVLASVSYTLSANVENLTLTGGDHVSATGNELDNQLTGNAGNNVLNGGAGADAMAGGAGDDTYVVDSELDTVVELADQGADTVIASLSYSLTDNVENLTLTGNALTATGNQLNNRLTGNAQDNILDGGLGADVMAGGEGSDTYVVDNVGDTVTEAAHEGMDTVLSSVSFALSANVENLTLTGSDNTNATGNALDNVLVGNSGNNLLDGGAGNDTYVYELNGGLDVITDISGSDTVLFGVGLTLDNVALRIVTSGAQKVAQVRVLDASGNEQPTQGFDFVMSTDSLGRLSSPLESFVFADGSTYLWNDLLIQSTSLIGTNNSDLLIGGRNDDYIDGSNSGDVLYGGSGNDLMYGGNGADILFGGGGKDKLYGGNDDDQLYGEAGDDLLNGDNGADVLFGGAGDDKLYGGNDDDLVYGEAGNDILVGENGNDYLLDLQGDNIFDGGNGRDIVQAGAGNDTITTGNDSDLVDAGAGNDVITTGNGDDWIAAGRGNDLINSGNGHNLFAFNKGDGADILNNTDNGDDVISLGAGIRYADLTLTKTGNDLVLGMGQGDSMTFKNWYANNQARNIDRLQVITVGGDYDAASTNKLVNKQVEVFNFDTLVQKFDAARAVNAANATGWAVMNSLLDAYLQSSNTGALGGDLSFQYATTGSLSGIGLTAAQSSLAAGSDNWQTLKTRSQLEQGAVRLM